MTVKELQSLAKTHKMPDYKDALKPALEEWLYFNGVISKEDVETLNIDELEEAEELEEVVVTEEEEKEYEPEINTAVIKNERGHIIREYTLDNHGNDFIDLAYEFANKAPNRNVVLVESVVEEVVKGPEILLDTDNPNAVQILHEGNLVRTYSLKAHGEDYEKLANEFLSAPNRGSYRARPVEITE